MDPHEPTGNSPAPGGPLDRAPGPGPTRPGDEAFARPAGVRGSFAATGREPAPFTPRVAPADPVQQQAFGPETRGEGGLPAGRGAAARTPEPGPAPPPDPWRDPHSEAREGDPALPAPAVRADEPGPALGVREVLFGRRVAPRALAMLAVLALAVGVVGGLIGRFTAESTSSLTSSKVRLVTPSDREEGEVGRVVEVASAVQPAVVSIEAATSWGTATGSGVIIDGEGYIVTNNHVITDAAQNPDESSVKVTFDDGQSAPARIVGRDWKTDLAVLKVDDIEGLSVARLGDADSLRVGEEAVAFGSPMGLSRTVTTGIVSALNRPVRLTGEGNDPDTVIDAVQTDAAINTGNSGGPLTNAAGEVIGINTAIHSPTGGSIGLGFAVPVNTVAEVAQRLIADGQMQHSEIGVNTRSVSNDQVTGAEVANVIEGGPAQAAGLLEGDVIIRIGERSVADADESVVAVRALPAGQAATVEVVRAGQRVELQVTPELE